MYKELPSRNAKVCVKDKNKFIPNDNETRLIQPIAVQNEIDALVSQVNKGRCFIRPSGTEDVVRIYAEAANENDVECIINKMILILKEY
jgi:phosphoacetylglucosamine mutase